MRIAVSACLLGENCKYNGGNNYSDSVAKFIKGHEVIGVCPEVLGGLSTPRKPAEIVNGIVQTEEGVSVDRQFREGARIAYDLIKEKDIELVILQSRSPSCGAKQIYNGTFTKQLVEGNGVFAELLKKNNIKVIDVEDLSSLDDSF